MRKPLALGLSLLFASCAVGPDYERPKSDAGEAFRMAETPADAPSLANLPWWELLKDEQLQALIKTALAENKDLQKAVAAVEEFQARALIAKSDFLPGITASGNAPNLGRKTIFLFPGFANPFNYYLQGNLSWELDIWGRIRRSNEAARADLLSKEENRRAVVLQLVSGVAESYFNLLQFDDQLDIAKRTLHSWEESVRIAQARLKQGMTSRLDTDQFEAERANAAARAAELERQMVQAENQLSVLLGRKPFAIPRGRALNDQMVPPAVPAGLPSDLLQRRPDLLEAEQQALPPARLRMEAREFLDAFPDALPFGFRVEERAAIGMRGQDERTPGRGERLAVLRGNGDPALRVERKHRCAMETAAHPCPSSPLPKAMRRGRSIFDHFFLRFPTLCHWSGRVKRFEGISCGLTTT